MRKNNLFRKALIVGIIVLFVGISIIPSIGSVSIKKQNIIECIPNNTTFDDEFPPMISEAKIIPKLQLAGEYVNISVNVTDNIGLADVCLFIKYPDDHWENFSIFHTKTGDTFYYNNVYDMIGLYMFIVWAIDVNDNIAFSSDYHFIITKLFLTSADGPYQGWTNTPIQFNGYAVGGTEPYSWHWDFGDGDSSNKQNPVHTYSEEGNYTVMLIVTDDEGKKAEDTTWTLILSNQPPNAPTIDGPKNGKVGVKLDYKFITTDPENDKIYYCVSWGCCSSGDFHTYGPYDSGVEVTISHTWSKKGNFIIKAYAKDIKEAISDTTTFDIKIPRNKATFSLNLLLRFLEQFPMLLRLLL